MDLLKSLLYSTGIWQQRPISNPLERSIISKLPPEVLVIIAEFLPPISAISFSLCCTPIYHLIGSKYRNTTRHRRFNITTLLSQLERNLPDHIVCYDCQKLHSIKHVSQYAYSKSYYSAWIPRIPPKCLHSDSEARSWIHPDFSTLVFRITMKRYHQGMDYLPFLELLSRTWQIFYHAKHIGTIASWCRIERGSLLVRTQAVFPLRFDESIRFIFEHVCLVCPHYDWRAFGPNDTTSELEWWYQQENFEAWGKLMNCKYCTTEFRIDVEYFEGLGKLIFFTRWQNLGKGKWPDHQWQSHRVTNKGVIWKRASFRPGSIASAFEKQEFEFSSLLTPEDKQKLFELPLESPWTKDIRLYKAHLKQFIIESSPRDELNAIGIREGFLQRRSLLYY